MGENENSEESAVLESYKDFISIKGEPNLGITVAVAGFESVSRVVDVVGFEPTTSWLQTKHSSN